MTDYFLRVSGSDGAAGTSPATAWATLGKAIGATPGMASGDRVFIGGGVFRLSAAVAIGLAPTAATFLIGDPTGANTGDAGEVVISGYGTNDSTTPLAANLFTLAAARNFYTFQNITFRCGQGSIAALVGAHDWTFQDCTFYSRIGGGSPFVSLTTIAGSPSNLLFQRCRFKQTSASAILAITSTLHTADYDISVVFKSCYLNYRTGSGAIQMNAVTGSGTGIPYGVQLLGCTFEGSNAALQLTSAAHSIAGGSAVSTVKYNILDCGTNAVLNAGNTNQVVSDYNRNPGGGAFTNVTAGAHDNATNNPSYFPDMGQAAGWGGMIRPWMTPGPNDPHLAFVASTEAAQTTDLLNRPVPAGGGSLNYPVGALGRHDTAVPGSVLTGDSGGWSELIGPGDQEYNLWCAPQSTTVSVKVKWDANAGDTNKPQLVRVANAAIGVTADTQTAVGTAGSAYEQLSTTFTPTAAGLVKLRVVSRSAAGNGTLAYDTFTVS